jgi:hypothetical protein
MHLLLRLRRPAKFIVLGAALIVRLLYRVNLRPVQGRSMQSGEGHPPFDSGATLARADCRGLSHVFVHNSHATEHDKNSID